VAADLLYYIANPNPNPDQADVAAYLLNYIAHNGAYSQERRNCQTFAADLFALLSGRRYM
tara:strand:- start:570 stop:749 length:180 start_codon:yes stop_codon:yes gene_type:complete